MNYLIGNNKRNINKLKCGDNFYPIIITSIGLSCNEFIFKNELSKALSAIKKGAQIINDNSLSGDIFSNYNNFLKEISVPFATIGINCLAKKIINNNTLKSNDLVNNVIKQIELGVDIITLHASIFVQDYDYIKNSSRIIPCTSRGGLMMLKYMIINNTENPYFMEFDKILSCAKAYDATISLCSSFRPASVYDCIAHNDLYWIEINRISHLVKAAIDCGVKVMVEGIGHCPINLIPEIISKTKQICYDVPYRVMSVSTDIALGYDHISSAIATSVAVQNGANLITCVTRSEHIGLPTRKDIDEAVLCTKIAIHSGYIAKSMDFSKDIEMSISRSKKGCRGDINLSIDILQAKSSFLKHKIKNNCKSCEICNKSCAFEILTKLEKI